MSDIQASVVINDKIDKSIETKLTSLADKSLKASDNITKLNNAIKGLSVKNINDVKKALQGLSNINPLKNINVSALQLVNSVSKSQVALAQANASMARTQLALQKVATEQARTASIAQRSADQQATASARIAEIKRREKVAEERLAAAKALTAQRLARLAQIQAQATTTTRSYSSTLLGLVSIFNRLSAGIANFSKLVNFGDIYQGSINKLTLVTETAEKARDRLISLSEGALASYGNLESYTSLYTRLTLALQNVGGTATEALSITKTLSQAIALTGLTAAESSSALLQISQAFNKGKLDGDEFRTVMETMPVLADAIADELTRTSNGVKILRGDLLALAPTGVITAEVMRKAFERASDQIAERFAKLTPTIGQQLENLRTSATIYLGQVFKNTGLAETLNSILKSIAQNLDTITKTALTVGSALGLAFAVSKVIAFGSVLKNLIPNYKKHRDEIIKATIAQNIHNKAIGKGTIAVKAFSRAIRISPIGLATIAISGLLFAFEELYQTFTGKSLIPSLDQDNAKLNDMLERLDEINKKAPTLSIIDTSQEIAKNAKAQLDLGKNIEQNEKAIAKLNFTIKQHYDAVNQTKFNYEDLINTGGIVVGEFSLMRLSAEQLTNKNAELAEKQQELAKQQKQQGELVKSQIILYARLKEKYDYYVDIVNKAKNGNSVNNEELKHAQEQIAKIDKEQGNLNSRIIEFVGILGKLGLVNLEKGAELAIAFGFLNEQRLKEQEAVNRASLTEFKQLDEKLERQRLINKARLEGNDALVKTLIIQDKLADKEHLKNITVDGKAITEADRKKGVKSAYDAAFKKQSVIYDQNEALKLQQQSVKLSESRAKQLEKAIQKLDQYKTGLIDENNLLQEGYGSYQKYTELYKIKAELQSKGKTLSEDEIDLLKKQIDLNNDLKKLAKEIHDIEENSYEKKLKNINLQLRAIREAKIPEKEKIAQTEDVYKKAGVTTDVNQGVQGIQNEYDFKLNLLRKYHEEAKIAESEFSLQMQGLQMERDQAIYDQRIANLKQMGVIGQATAAAFDSFTSNATNSILNMLQGTESVSESMRNLARTMLTDVIRAIIQVGVRMVAMQLLNTALGKSAAVEAQTTAATTGASITASMTPAATVTSIATQGASTSVGLAAMFAAMAAIPALIALAGKRKNGGAINAGDLYQVGEGNAPEIYQSRSGRQYMIAGDNGRVFSNREVNRSGNGNGGTTIIQNITYQSSGNDAQDQRTIKNLNDSLRASILQVIRTEQRPGGELWR